MSDRQRSDIELLLNGGFAPLVTFNSKKDYDSILDNLTLSDGSVWPIPITLDLTEDFIKTNSIEVNSTLQLREKEGFIIATLKIFEIWKIDKEKEALFVYGTKDIKHPGVSYLFNKTGDYYVAGELKKVALSTFLYAVLFTLTII